MRDLFHDPVGWAGTMVDSWLWFAFSRCFSFLPRALLSISQHFRGGLPLWVQPCSSHCFNSTCCMRCVGFTCSYDAPALVAAVWHNPALNRAGRHEAAFLSASARPAR